MTTEAEEEVEIPEPEEFVPGDSVDNDDGTTTLIIEGNERPTDDDWFADLSQILPESTLKALAQKYLDLIEHDRQSRKERDNMQAAGLKKAGLGDPAPGGADFEGASRATHPVLMEAYVDFAASSMKELFPPNGPVRAKVEGKPNKKKMDIAKRKAEFMNWQLTQEIRSYRPELERLLTQLPVGGSQYMKLYWDDSKQQPNAEFIPIDDMVLPFEARNFFDLQRKFHRMLVSDFEYERRVQSGLYRDLSLGVGYAGAQDVTASARQTEKIQGAQNDYASESGERYINEGCVFDIIDGDDKAPEDKAVPYLITIDEESQEILALYRNWNEADKTHSEIEYIVDWNFIPWRGVFALSLLQCLGGLPDALTGSLRALLDSALISNMQGGLKLKGNPGGASLTIAPTQITEVDAMGSDDIRKIYMPIPFNTPSPMLFQLLGFLTDAAKSVVGTAEEKIADAGANMAVGTTLALIEQGAKVFSSIHARLHDSQRRCLEILHRLNRDHLAEKVQYGTDEEDFVTPEDFSGPMDVHPVSDPNIFSETQRFAQIQFALQIAQQNEVASQINPSLSGIFKMRELYARAFEMAKIPDYEEFLPQIPEAMPLNPADENIKMAMGEPVKAYEGQNHEAHIQVLLDFAQNPLWGANPILAMKFLPAAMNHLTDHLLVWYGETMKAAIGKIPDLDNDPDVALAMAQNCKLVDKAAELAFEKIPAMVTAGMQKLQSLAPKPPVDPMVQIAQQQLSQQQQLGQAKMQQTAQEHADDVALKTKDAETKQTQVIGDLVIKGVQTHVDALGKTKEAQLSSQTQLAQTLHDNHTQHKIADLNAGKDILGGVLSGLNKPTEMDNE